MNPLTQLPAKARLYIYAAVWLASVGLAAWQAADGDLVAALTGVAGAVGSTVAAANVPTVKRTPGQEG